MPTRFVVSNLNIQIKNIAAIGGNAARYMNQVVERAIKLDVYPQWVKQISLNDHSLEDLAKLGHPYSVRYGKDSFVHADDVVHVQDGNLLARSQIVGEQVGNVIRWQLVNDSPEYVYLRYGTSKMRMRDPGTAAMFNSLPLVRARFASEVRAAIIKVALS